jgi:hypothetical protein
MGTTLSVSVLGSATQVAESESNAQCVVRLLVPSYPYADRVSNTSGALRAAVNLDAQGAVQSQEIEIVSGPKDQRFFKAAIDRGLKASTFNKTCAGRTVRLTFRFKMGGADAVWFEYPSTYEITALPPLLNTARRRKE